MSGFLLDTNIASDMIKPSPHDAVLRWLNDQLDTQLFFSAVSLGELWRGIAELPVGRRRDGLEAWYTGPGGPRQWFGTRVLPLDGRVAEAWAELIADGKRAGRPRSPIDMMIAATALVRGLTVVSLNDRDFNGVVPLINPTRV